MVAEFVPGWDFRKCDFVLSEIFHINIVCLKGTSGYRRSSLSVTCVKWNPHYSYWIARQGCERLLCDLEQLQLIFSGLRILVQTTIFQTITLSCLSMFKGITLWQLLLILHLVFRKTLYAGGLPHKAKK